MHQHIPLYLGNELNSISYNENFPLSYPCHMGRCKVVDARLLMHSVAWVFMHSVAWVLMHSVALMSIDSIAFALETYPLVKSKWSAASRCLTFSISFLVLHFPLLVPFPLSKVSLQILVLSGVSFFCTVFHSLFYVHSLYILVCFFTNLFLSAFYSCNLILSPPFFCLSAPIFPFFIFIFFILSFPVFCLQISYYLYSAHYF